MDEYRENVKKVQKALEQDAAFLQPNPYLAQRVLNAANGKGGTRVRKKISFSLVLVLVLLSLAVAAVAAVLLSMRDIVEDYVVPTAQEYDGNSLPADETRAILKLAEENNITISQEGKEQIDFALMQNDSYYKDELVRSLAKTEFGEDPLQWSLEQQKWYADVCEILGLGDESMRVLPANSEEATTQSIQWAKAHIQEQQGTSIDLLNKENYVTGVQYTSGCEEINYSGMCWTVWFSPLALDFDEYVVHMDENGTLLNIVIRPGLSPESTVDDVYHMYRKIFGNKKEWSQDVLISFREAILKTSDENHQAYLCMLRTTYPKSVPENAINVESAIQIGVEYLHADTYIVVDTCLIETDKNPVWKIRLRTDTEQWSFEIDSFSREICTVRQIGFGDTKWWMPIVRWEIVDEVRESWIDMSPNVG